MIEQSADLLSFIELIRDKKVGINSILSANPEGNYVYYIAPLSNVIRIYQSGGILPRNLAKDYVDLSGHGVQKSRDDKKLKMVGRKGIRWNELHNCVNFFLNPFNFTYYQFRRNALVRAQSGDPWSQVVCILEIDVRKMLETDLYYWCISNKNLASSGSRVEVECQRYAMLDWDKIYSIGSCREKGDLNDFRAAEWIVRPVEVNGERRIHCSCINRVLVLDRDIFLVRNINFTELPFQITQYKAGSETQVLCDPLDYDKKFSKSLDDLNRAGISPLCIIQALQRLLVIEAEINLKLTDSFDDSTIARSSIHGAGHIVRVMFWVLVLSTASNASGVTITDEETTLTLYAAFIHDLCRVNNEIETRHGEDAARKYEPIFSKMLSKEAVKRCLNAVRLHDQIQEPYDSDCVWRLLKDADAIDRGRFRAPDTPGGCESGLLRIPFLKNLQWRREKILWSAYWLARVTKYTEYKDAACENFVFDVLRSLNMVMEYEGKTSSSHPMAKEICLNVAGVRSKQTELF